MNTFVYSDLDNNNIIYSKNQLKPYSNYDLVIYIEYIIEFFNNFGKSHELFNVLMDDVKKNKNIILYKLYFEIIEISFYSEKNNETIFLFNIKSSSSPYLINKDFFIKNINNDIITFWILYNDISTQGEINYLLNNENLEDISISTII